MDPAYVQDAACPPSSLPPLFSKLFQESELQRLAQAREQELRFAKEQADLDVSRAEALAAVEVKKFEAVIKSLGASTIRDIAVAGPEMQVRSRERRRRTLAFQIMGVLKLRVYSF